jgi:hypothetical protein
MESSLRVSEGEAAGRIAPTAICRTGVVVAWAALVPGAISESGNNFFLWQEAGRQAGRQAGSQAARQGV